MLMKQKMLGMGKGVYRQVSSLFFRHSAEDALADGERPFALPN